MIDLHALVRCRNLHIGTRCRAGLFQLDHIRGSHLTWYDMVRQDFYQLVLVLWLE